MKNLDSKGTKRSANVRATGLFKVSFKNISFRENGRPAKKPSLHTYGVLWIH